MSEDNDQLVKGIAVEKEHTNTIKKIMAGKVKDVSEAAKMIAQDHLNEIPTYYDALEKMEQKYKKIAEDGIEEEII